nr:uncharacterized protein CI109_001785 [Kwoniella shandongensis]KAA5529845.1 hypothetical protein CI109_001785 [Kwoniella shandongensis]
MSPSISLTNVESTFVTLLDDFARRLEPPVECRIAGGWVRDKLLSLPSHDLDIALSIPSGHTFAVDFVEYLKTKDVATGSVGKVAANPEQSKHLETGTTRIMGLECDFVGLRSETYADSRIPQVRPGTPLEDASRRDLTINALFYNVHTKEVEDYTQRGLSDLENGIACTPLPPRQTFQDDPLRIIRCVRFASRFGLSITDEVVQAIKEDDVKLGITTKVSKERIGIEVTKMLRPDPLRAMALIDSLALHSAIFHCEVDPPRHEAIASARILSEVSKRFISDDALWLATAATPFRDIKVKRKGKDTPAVSVVISEGLKHPSVRPWERSLTWAVVMDILPFWNGEWSDQAEAVVNRYQAFKDRAIALGLPQAIDQPLLLNGTEMQSLLSIKPSPLLNTIRQAINVWQLDHPEGTKEECEGWLKNQWEGEGRAEWETVSLPMRAKVEKVKGEKRKR